MQSHDGLQFSRIWILSFALSIACTGGGGSGGGGAPDGSATGETEVVNVAPNGVWVANEGTSLIQQNSSLARVSPDDMNVSARLVEEGKAASNTIKVKPQAVVSCGGSIWVGASIDNVLHRINPRTNQITATVSDMPSDSSLTCVDNELWSSGKASRDIWVHKISEGTTSQINTSLAIADQPRGIIKTPYGVWVLDINGRLIQVDPSTKAKVAHVAVSDSGKSYWPLGLTASGDFVWVLGQNLDTNKLALIRINVKDKTVDAAKADTDIDGFSAEAWAFGVENQLIALGEDIWVPIRAQNKVVRLNAATGAVRDSVSVGAGPRGIALGFGSLWVTNATDNTLSRIDPTTRTVLKTFEVGAKPVRVAISTE